MIYDEAGNPDLWPTIQKRVRERKVKSYLHVWPAEPLCDPFLEEIFNFARSTDGAAKIGPLPRPGEEISAPSP